MRKKKIRKRVSIIGKWIINEKRQGETSSLVDFFKTGVGDGIDFKRRNNENLSWKKLKMKWE